MPCRTVPLPDGGFAMVCSRGRRPSGRCKVCNRPSSVLCDFPSTIKPGTTCDRPLCREHARSVGPDRDYCITHPVPETKVAAEQRDLDDLRELFGEEKA